MGYTEIPGFISLSSLARLQLPCQGNSCHNCSFTGPTDQHFDAKVENDDGHSDLETVVATLSWGHGPIVNGVLVLIPYPTFGVDPTLSAKSIDHPQMGFLITDTVYAPLDSLKRAPNGWILVSGWVYRIYDVI